MPSTLFIIVFYYYYFYPQLHFQNPLGETFLVQFGEKNIYFIFIFADLCLKATTYMTIIRLELGGP